MSGLRQKVQKQLYGVNFLRCFLFTTALVFSSSLASPFSLLARNSPCPQVHYIWGQVEEAWGLRSGEQWTWSLLLEPQRQWIEKSSSLFETWSFASTRWFYYRWHCCLVPQGYLVWRFGVNSGGIGSTGLGVRSHRFYLNLMDPWPWTNSSLPEAWFHPLDTETARRGGVWLGLQPISLILSLFHFLSLVTIIYLSAGRGCRWNM